MRPTVCQDINRIGIVRARPVERGGAWDVDHFGDAGIGYGRLVSDKDYYFVGPALVFTVTDD